MADRRILVIGDVIDDVVVVPRTTIRADTDTDAAISMRPGGSAANAAAWLGAAGAQVDFVGRAGRADLDRHTSALATHGVRAMLVPDDRRPTGSIVIIVEGRHRTMLTQRGANAAFTGDDVLDEVLDGCAHLHLTGYSVIDPSTHAASRRLLDRAAARGLTVSVDPASAGYLADLGVDRFWEVVGGIDVILPNLEEGRLLSGERRPDEIVAALLELIPVVVLTLGADGALVGSRGVAPVHVPAVPMADAVDATGAGDAFAAGFLAGWTTGGDVVDAARHGARLGARAVGCLGGRPCGSGEGG